MLRETNFQNYTLATLLPNSFSFSLYDVLKKKGKKRRTEKNVNLQRGTEQEFRFRSWSRNDESSEGEDEALEIRMEARLARRGSILRIYSGLHNNAGQCYLHA